MPTPPEFEFMNLEEWEKIFLWARECGFNLPTFIRRAMMFEYPGTSNDVWAKFYEISENQFHYACWSFRRFHLSQASK